MEYYDRLTKHLGKLNEGELEVKKNIIYEGLEYEQCITIHSAKLVADKVDYGLQKMSEDEKPHVKYISFKNSTKVEKLAGLHLNRLINCKVKYEQFDNLFLLESAQYNGQEETVGQLLMRAKSNGIPIFNGVE